MEIRTTIRSRRHCATPPRAFSFLLGYTYSKSIDEASALGDTVNPFNYKSTRSLSAWDLRHNLVASYQYQLPFAKVDEEAAFSHSGLVDFAESRV